MLTGDKKETALCIGQACGLLTNADEVLDICSAPNKDVALSVDETHAYLANNAERDPDRPASLVVDGAALNTIMSDAHGEELKWKLSEIGECCETVIACR